MSEAVLFRIEAIAERVGRSEGIEIVDIELKGAGNRRFLRIYIDKPEGVTHADCESISGQVGAILDVEDVVPGQYTLEVSSPGVQRKLAKPRDFERVQGKKIKLVLREPVENERIWDGVLARFAEGTITLELAGGRSLAIPYDLVQKANLKFEW